ncbi:MAG: hypothetical protein QMD22_06705 [archaeon]|nr:hypothetical protein [archaeon]
MIAGLVVLALVATAVGVISARNNLGVQPPMLAHQWSQGPCGMNQLTEEERQEVLQQMQEFKQQICDQYNITCPSGPMSHLTEEERQEVRQKIQEFRQGQRQEAQEFKQQICDQYNITCPSDPKFVDEDGDGINDNMRPHGWRYWRGPGFRWLAQTSTQEE